MRFKVAIAGGFAENYVERCLTSLRQQTETAWSAQVVLDPVGDRTLEQARAFASERIRVRGNDEPACAVANMMQAVRLLECEDEDVVVLLDADDWLRDETALATVRAYYERNPRTLVTHGSWVWYPGYRDGTSNLPYREQDFALGLRRQIFRATHLRTMKYKLLRRIRDQDLRDRRGRYYRSAGDMALMFPALEMAGFARVTFIPERLYVYNRETRYNESKVRELEQRAMGMEICLKRPYTLQDDL